MSRRIHSPDTAADIELRRILDGGGSTGFLMIAGAGSGKTTSLIKALAHVVSSRGPALRAAGQQVACITYTEVASREILDDLADNPLVHVSTIHSFLWKVAKPFQVDIRKWVRRRVEQRLCDLESEVAGFSSRVGQKRREASEARILKLKLALPRIDHVENFTYGVGSDYGRGVLGHEDITTMVPELIGEKPLLPLLIARQYPAIFVDESQDTLPEVVECLKCVARGASDRFCLGFFGDPMQKIYVRGIGAVPPESGWVTVKKPENFRSPLKVLDLINRIRSNGDGLEQVSGLPEKMKTRGEVNFFVLPADETRLDSLVRVRSWLSNNSRIGAWEAGSEAQFDKILVIAHRMAARRLGFEKLYDVFHVNDALRDAFNEGRAWPLVPFISTLLPIVDAASGDRAKLVQLLRKTSPALRNERLEGVKVSELLATLSAGVSDLVATVEDGGASSVGKALEIARGVGLVEIDGRWVSVLERDIADPAMMGVRDDVVEICCNLLQCDVHELKGYQKYLDGESPYSTHQGVKGAEYPNVLVVLDDEEGNHRQFSYDKLLGIRQLSKNDLEREAAGDETIVERTRRLLYVCASRATKALAVLIYSADVKLAADGLLRSGIVGDSEVHTIEDLQPFETA
ncbi:UvrD-helicase domain-containing protein [Lentzea sp. NPDC051213]|uniref:UvrD-helicase domain-containing protein n=1 Tax=Lentzea sp. NPDC051213 TaxID=3364126 RepID=UPI0037AC871F